MQFDKNNIRDKLIQLYQEFMDDKSQVFLNEFIKNKFEKDYSMV